VEERLVDIAINKKARFEYDILDTVEAGIVLAGTEVKSIRLRRVSIQEAYARIKGGEVYIVGMNISPYEMGNRYNHEPNRDRKLLLHRQEIKRLTGKLKERGLTMVPLKIYFKNGKVKVLMGLGRGKSKYDKRKAIQKRDLDREIQREMKDRY
jgi:SsrA-binding protein